MISIDSSKVKGHLYGSDTLELVAATFNFGKNNDILSFSVPIDKTGWYTSYRVEIGDAVVLSGMLQPFVHVIAGDTITLGHLLGITR